MIESKRIMKEYIQADLIAQFGKDKLPIADYVAGLFRPMIWKYIVKLRKTEYWANCKSRNPIGKIIYLIKSNNLKKYGYKLGYTIPINAIGPGLCLAHVGTIVINDNVKIGLNARIHVGVNIGNSSEFGVAHVNNNVPFIGNNVYIGPGAKIFGNITIGDNARIGENAVVTHDVPANVTVAGSPARVISSKGSFHGLQVYKNQEKGNNNA